jgi:hypothetical protein
MIASCSIVRTVDLGSLEHVRRFPILRGIPESAEQ